MPDPRERIYELALRALDEQERQVDHLRSRAGAVIAAAGVGVTLLAEPVFHRSHPDGWAEIGATALGLAGAAGVVLATAYLLVSRPLAFSVDARRALTAAEALDVLDDGRLFDESMALALRDRREGNEAIVGRLHTAFSAAVAALLAELTGLAAAAALAS
jgi:hypothetical protein